MKNKIVFKPMIESKLFFKCPDCGEPRKFGLKNIGETSKGINCYSCGGDFDITRINETEFEITNGTSSQKCFRSLTLLRSYRPNTKGRYTYIVVESLQFAAKNAKEPHDYNDGKEYFYNDHTCPWNWLRLPVMEDGDDDPHGIFQHQETVAWPKPDTIEGFEYEDGCLHLSSIDAWYALFPSLKNGVGINFTGEIEKDFAAGRRTLNELQLMIYYAAVRDGTPPTGYESVQNELFILLNDGYLRKDIGNKIFITEHGDRYVRLISSVEL